MARIKDGSFLGASGKFGKDFVFVQAKNGTYVRQAVERSTMASSEGQKKQSTKFGVMMNFLKHMSLFLHMGYCERDGRKTSFAMAMSYNLRNAMKDGEAGWTIDYTQVRVSGGSLTPADGAQVAMTSAEALFTWTDNSGVGTAAADDVALPLAYNIGKGEALYIPRLGAVRHDGKAVLPLSREWKGQQVALYLGFASADGSLSADSVFLGLVVVP